MSTESSQACVSSSTITLPELVNDFEVREESGRNVSSSRSHAFSKSVDDSRRRQKMAKKKEKESWSSLTAALMVETLLIVCVLFGTVFAFFNASSNFFYVVFGLLALEFLYYVVSMIAHFMDIESAFNFVVAVTLIILIIECGVDMYFLFSDISTKCDNNGCTFFTGPAIYRFSFCMFVIFLAAIHVIFAYVFLYDIYMMNKKQQKKEEMATKTKVSRSRSQSESRSRSGSKSRRRKSTCSHSVQDDSSTVSRPRSIRRKHRSVQLKAIVSRRSVKTDISQTNAGTVFTQTQTESTGPSFVPISHRQLSNGIVHEPTTTTFSRSEHSSSWTPFGPAAAAGHALTDCPVARGQCNVPTCPFFNPNARPHVQPRIMGYPGGDNNYNRNRPIVVDMPQAANNNQSSVEIQRIIVRLPQQSEAPHPNPVQQIVLPPANPQHTGCLFYF